jgi:hypothetical protein
MDYFGRVVDELSELWERIGTSPHAADAKPLQRALEKAMCVAVKIENERVRRRLDAPMIGHNGGPPTESRQAIRRKA